MSRFACVLGLVHMFLAAASASAFDLVWSSGAPDISITAAARCTLIVRTSALEGPLPSEWRLLYVADNGPPPRFLPDSTAEDIAVACVIDPQPLPSVVGHADRITHCLPTP
ncbi:MAG: hypothetical protein ACRD1T_04735, partial [Acidimicrobiia bacterium]